MKILMWD